MKEVIETGKDKVQKICDVLRKETLDPAIHEAEGIIADAKSSAGKIVEEAKAKAASMIYDAENEIEKKHQVFQATLHQGARKSLEWLKQEIEQRLLNQNLSKNSLWKSLRIYPVISSRMAWSVRSNVIFSS